MSQSGKAMQWTIRLLYGLAAGLLAYSCYRAATLSFTFDEVWSYNDYVRQSWDGILSYELPSANHHLLNTLLMKVSLGIFGLSEFALRLPNVIAHAVYLYFSIRLVQGFRHPVLVLVAFLLLNLDPYVLDFFSLARGYGLALAALMGSAYGLRMYLHTGGVRPLLGTLFGAAIAVLANFSFLHVYLAAFAVLGIATLVRARRRSYGWGDALFVTGKRALPALLMTAVLVLTIWEPVRKLLGAEQFYYGGKTGFWADTVTTGVYNLIYRIDHWKYDVLLLKWTVVVLFAGMLALGIWQLLRTTRQPGRTPLIYFLLLLVLPAVSSIAQHHLTGANYLLDRSALFFHPLFFLALAFGMEAVFDLDLQLRWKRAIGVVWGILMLLNAAASLNFDHSLEWKYDASTREMLSDLAALEEGQQRAEPVRLGVSWQFRLSVNFYREKDGLEWLAPVHGRGCAGEYDYWYVLRDGKGCRLPDDKLPFWENEGREVLHSYPLSGAKLGR